MNSTARRRAIVAAMALAVLSLSLPAAAQQDARRLSPQEVVDAVVARSPSLKAAATARQRAALAVEAEDYRYVPLFTADGGFRMGRSVQASPGGTQLISNSAILLGATLAYTLPAGTQLALDLDLNRADNESVVLGNLGTTYGSDLRLSVVQPLLRGFGLDAGEAALRQARLGLERAQLEQDLEASQQLAQALDAYWQMWFAQQEIQIQTQALEVAAQSIAEANERLEVGVLAEADLIALQSEAASIEERLVTSRARLRQTAAALARIMGAKLDQIPQAVIPDAPPLPPQLTAEAAIARAMARSPQLAQLKTNVALAQIEAEVAEDAALPRLDLVGNVGISGLGEGLSDAFGQLVSFDAVVGYLGLQLELPLVNRARQAQAERASLAVSEARLRYEIALDAIEADVVQRLTAMDAAREKLALARRAAALARQSVEAQQARFEVDKATSLDVVQALQNARETELRVAAVLVEMVQAQLGVEELTGGILGRIPATAR